MVIFHLRGHNPDKYSYLEETDLKAKFKMAILGALCLFTIFFAAFVLVDFGQAEDSGEAVSAMAESSDTCYALRDYEGYVAIFVENDLSCPMTVTDIQGNHPPRAGQNAFGNRNEAIFQRKIDDDAGGPRFLSCLCVWDCFLPRLE